MKEQRKMREGGGANENFGERKERKCSKRERERGGGHQVVEEREGA